MRIKELLGKTMPNFLVRVSDMKLVEGRKVDTPTKVRRVEGMLLNQVSKAKHICVVEALTPGRLSDVNVKVSCDCENFKYICEYALNRAGAADIHFSNGGFPKVTNPQCIPTMCTHLVKFCRIVLQKNY